MTVASHNLQNMDHTSNIKASLNMYTLILSL
jgi:hypothetical protein